MAKKENLPFGFPTTVGCDRLVFDHDNPRFALDRAPQDKTTTALIKYLWAEENLRDILRSVAENGFLDFEPLIVCGTADSKGNYVVYEGNRRLAAVALLREKKLADKTGISLPENIQSTVTAKSLRIHVFPVASRSEARTFVGIKHISGPQKWDPVAKARYLFDWYFESAASGESLGLNQIASKIGDSGRTVRRLMAAYILLAQAKQKKLYFVEDRNTAGRLGLSQLYTAIERDSVREFLGLGSEWLADPISKSPVAKKDLAKLKELLVWLFGSKSQGVGRVISSQNPDIPNLSRVLRSKVGLARLRDTGSLASAMNAIAEEEAESEGEKPGKIKAKTKTKTAKPEKSKTHHRPHIAGDDTRLSLPDGRIGNVYIELETLHVDDFENCGSVLMRVFLEFSVDEYIKVLELGEFKDESLYKRVTRVINDLSKKKLLSPAQKKEANKITNSPLALWSAKTFNEYVHDSEHFPSPVDLKIAWDNLYPFYSVLWETVIKKG